jgi:hypothetical protein
MRQPSSDGFPEGLIDQRFSAGSADEGGLSALQRALTTASASRLKLRDKPVETGFAILVRSDPGVKRPV